MGIRDLVFSIGWRVNDRALRNADRRTDEFVGTVRGAERSMSSLAQEISNMAQRGERAFSDLEGNSRELDTAINRINDPHLSSAQAERELQNIRSMANRLGLELRDFEMEVDNSQARRSIDDIEDRASNLQDIIGGLGGAAGGSLIAEDITSFAQIPRELEANLGVTENIAKGLATEVKGVWVDVKDISKGEAAQAVETANRVFDVTGDRAGELGQKIAILNKNTGEDFHNIGLAARNMVERFPDIKTEAQAFDMLYESQQRLGSEGFSELIDQTQEYGSVLSQALSGQDFFSSMIQGGEMNLRIMDKLGDTLSTELIPRIQQGDEDMIDALTTVAANAEGIKGVTGESIEKFQDLKDKISDLKEEGKEVPKELTSKFTEMKNKLSPAINVVGDWRESIVAGGEDGRTATKELLGAFSELEGEQKKVLGTEIFATMYEEQGPALEKLIESLANGTEQFGASMKENQTKNEGFLNSVKTRAKEVRASISGLTESFGAIGEGIGSSLPFVGAFVGAGGLGKIKPVAKVGWKAIKKVGQAGKWMGKTMWQGAKLAGKGAGIVGKGIGKLAVTGVKGIGKLARFGINGFKTLGRGALNLGSKAWNLTKTIGRGLGSAGRIVGRFAASGGRAIINIAGKVGGLASRFGGLAMRIGSKVLPLIVRFGPKLLKIGGPIGLIAGLAIDLGITIVRNWDKISAKTEQLWGGIQTAWNNIDNATSTVWYNVEKSVVNSINGIINKVNWLIEKINVIPGVTVPIVPKIEAPNIPAHMLQNNVSGMTDMGAKMAPNGSHASGLYRVPFDGYLSELHKDESVLTAKQSNTLRDRGILSGEGKEPKLNLSEAEMPSSYGGGERRSSSYQESNPLPAFAPQITIHVNGSDEGTSKKIKRELERLFPMMMSNFIRIARAKEG